MITKTKFNINILFPALTAAIFSIYILQYNALNFVAYFLLYTVIPGYAIADILLRKTTFDNSFIKLACSSFLGIFLLFCCYFLLYRFPTVQHYALVFLPPAVVVVYILICIKQKQYNFISDIKNTFSSRIFCLSAVFVLIMMLVNIVLYFPDKSMLDYQDYVWHISLVNSLSSGHPFVYYNATSGILSYHYFSDLYLAIGKMIFGFDGFNLIIQFQPIALSFIVASACMGFYHFIFKDDVQKYSFATIALLTGFGPGLLIFYFNFFNHFSSQFYSNVNAITFSIPLLLVTLWITTKVLLSTEKFSIFTLGLVCVFFFMLTGAKGPFGVVLIVSFAAAAVIKTIVYRKADIPLYIYIAGAAFSFFIAFTTFMGDSSSGLTLSVQDAFSVVGMSSLWHSLMGGTFMYVSAATCC